MLGMWLNGSAPWVQSPVLQEKTTKSKNSETSRHMGTIQHRTHRYIHENNASKGAKRPGSKSQGHNKPKACLKEADMKHKTESGADPRPEEGVATTQQAAQTKLTTMGQAGSTEGSFSRQRGRTWRGQEPPRMRQLQTL